MFPWQWFKIRRVKNDLLEKILSIFTSEMELAGIKFQQYGVIIFDVSADFEILFGMWNGIILCYPCAKFHHVMTINNGINWIFHVFCFVCFWTNERGLSIMTS